MIGTTLGHYEILEKLGHGGMGEVYEAEDSKLKRRVALKVLSSDLTDDPERLRRFQREAETVAALNHPNIVTIYSVEQEGPTRFLTMEKVEGKALDQLIPSGGMPLERVFELAIPLADALSAAHERGIVHRDLKPANVMVTGEGRVKVLDFGLAKLLEEVEEPSAAEGATQALTEDGKVMGTVPYMSPEQVQGKPLDRRSDIFSLGVMLYEMSTGRRPFTGDSSAELISSILRDSPSSVTELRVELPHHLGRIVRHCLEKDPKRRYQAALDVRNELEALRREVESGVVAPETRVMERARPVLSGAARKLLAAAAAAALVLLIAFVGWRLLRPEGSDRPETGTAGAGAEDRPSVAVLYFDNLSGDEELEWLRAGLTDMLVTDLSQSPDLRVLSTDRLYQILAELKKLDERITSFEVVSEVAERAGATKVVLGTFAKLGDTIRISIKIQAADSGEILQARHVDASVEEDLFSRIDQLSREVRRGLELPERPVIVADRDLEEVTTSSVLAYRRFVEAEQLHYQSRDQEAIPLYLEAVELDPRFAMAWAKLATVHSNLGMVADSRRYAEKSMELVNRLTEPERAYVEGRYWGRKFETTAKAIEVYSKTLERFPHLTAIANNLGVLYSNVWMEEEAIAAFEQSIAYGDEFPGTYTGLASSYAGLGKEERAFEILDDFARENPGSFTAHTTRASLLLARNELDAAEESLRRAEEIQPGFLPVVFLRFQLAVLRDDRETARELLGPVSELPFPFARSAALGLEAALNLMEGRVAEPLELSLRGIETWPEPGPGRSQSQLGAGVIRLLLDRPEAAIEHLRAARRSDPGSAVDYVAHALEAAGYVALGQLEEAERVLEEVTVRSQPLPGEVMKVVLHEVRGRLAAARGDRSRAIREIEAALEALPMTESHRPRLLHLLGTLYRDAGRLREAEVRFAAVVERPYYRLLDPLAFGRSEYELARLLEQRQDRAGADRLYRRFVERWGEGELDREEIARARGFLAGA